MTEQTKRIMLSVEGSPLDEDGDLADLEGEVVEIPADAGEWRTVQGQWKFIFGPSGGISGGVQIFRPVDRRSQ